MAILVYVTINLCDSSMNGGLNARATTLLNRFNSDTLNRYMHGINLFVHRVLYTKGTVHFPTVMINSIIKINSQCLNAFTL